jgi:predicted NBD/HSP70 family sugar kinase
VNSTDRPRIGIDLGGTKIEAVLMDPSGTILRRERVATPRHDYRQTIDTIHELVEALEADLGSPASVGIGTPGAISPATGTIKNANSVWLNGMPLLDDLQRALNREVRMANDADCFALSEAIDGAGRDAETVFGVILGTGVGGGVVVGRRLLAGPNAIAGEWGHNALPWPLDDERPGPECYCGLSGCIETFLSGPGLERDYAAAVGAPLPGAEIVEAADEGDAQADAALQRYEGRLARALASVINVVDPHVIVLGGGLSKIARLYENVPRLWDPFVFSDRVDTRLVPPIHGDAGGVRGAAWLW